MLWTILYTEAFYSRDGYREVLYILQGPTYPAQYYAGPGLDGNNKAEPIIPRFNATNFYHRTQDDALRALIEMKDGLL